jgi:hypothetical protein
VGVELVKLSAMRRRRRRSSRTGWRRSSMPAGTVDVLRHGVVDLGVTIRLAFFRPAHGLTPELVERYEQNRLTVTRQLPYEAGSTKTLDVRCSSTGCRWRRRS